MNNPSNIERVVMRRVHTIHVLRPILSFSTLSLLVVLVALWGIGREVWVARVLENMGSNTDPVSFARFWLAAFDHTRLTVQALSIVTIAALAYLARATARLVTYTLSPQSI